MQSLHQLTVFGPLSSSARGMSNIAVPRPQSLHFLMGWRLRAFRSRMSGFLPAIFQSFDNVTTSSSL
jgi:hypothetical protein